ncbi:helix-turn-helix transcriptional regulator [Paramicrobacterium sp. CJ85]|uniref:helix-turn-helix transcriptional regulator n=1 Tax=Paramicrobacterium sp. CJ85 TaxID=3445355 RepID=UPI003F63888F
MQQLIRRLVTPPTGMSAAELARRSRVNRSTIHRIARGETEPTLATLRELAIVHGLDLEVDLRPLSDPAAASAARMLLDPTMEGYEPNASEQQWLKRLEQFDDPVDVVAVAGRASAPAERKAALLFRGDRSALRLASAGSAADGTWAVSGWAALTAAEGDAPRAGASILWVQDPDRAASMLLDTHTRVTSPLNAQVVVAQITDAVQVDSWSEGAVRYVAPVQILLDCIGLGGELERAARVVAESWSTE